MKAELKVVDPFQERFNNSVPCCDLCEVSQWALKLTTVKKCMYNLSWLQYGSPMFFKTQINNQVPEPTLAKDHHYGWPTEDLVQGIWPAVKAANGKFM